MFSCVFRGFKEMLIQKYQHLCFPQGKIPFTTEPSTTIFVLVIASIFLSFDTTYWNQNHEIDLHDMRTHLNTYKINSQFTRSKTEMEL